MKPSHSKVLFLLRCGLAVWFVAGRLGAPIDAQAQSAELVQEQTQAPTESAMMDALQAKIDGATHVLASFKNRDSAQRASDVLHEKKVWNLVRTVPPKDGAPMLYQVQVNPKEAGKISPDVRARLQKIKPLRGWNFGESAK